MSRPTGAGVERLALEVQLASFAGPVLTDEWAQLLEEGLGGICLFGSNLTGSLSDVADLVRAIRSCRPTARWRRPRWCTDAMSEGAEMEVRLGIDTCFAVKRWPRPEDWAPIVADRLGVPEGTVKSRINRGRAELARQVQQLNAESGPLGRTGVSG